MGRGRTVRRSGQVAGGVLLATGLAVMVMAGGSVMLSQTPLVSNDVPVRSDPVLLEIPPEELSVSSSNAEERLVASSSSSLPQATLPAAETTEPPSSSLAPTTLSTAEKTEPPSSESAVRADRRPSTLSIPAIEVSARVDALGLNADGSLEVPARGPSYDNAGWFTGSPSPGEPGPAVLLGHVNGRKGAPSVFFSLAKLRAGDPVSVRHSDGSQNVFEVYRIEQYPKDQFPTTSVYGDTAGSELRLITCAGAWDADVGHYQDNTVVYARELPTGSG